MEFFDVRQRSYSIDMPENVSNAYIKYKCCFEIRKQ